MRFSLTTRCPKCKNEQRFNFTKPSGRLKFGCPKCKIEWFEDEIRKNVS